MKFNNIIACAILGIASTVMVSCNDFLDREPITNVTPESYFTSVDQVANYLNNYYDAQLADSRGNKLYHPRGWYQGIALNDANTDNYQRGGGNLNYFANNWTSPTEQNLKGDYGNIRVWNYLIGRVAEHESDGTIQGNSAELKHYIGEAYFFRALCYFNTLVKFGDLPIIDEVLPNEEKYLQEKSVRAPRNEVARFILSDLDRAIARLQDVGFKNNQRINKQTAQLFKSRVALFEGTFEKYHKGSGRIPGDANWPGGSFNGNIDGEISFFLTEAMNAAAAVADITPLTANSHVIDPELGQIYGWNPYFEMFSQPSLAGVPEVLLWKQYDKSLSVTHNCPARTKNGDNSGLTRSQITSYLMKNGLPIYAEGSGYAGDKSIDDEATNRDERMQLFVWHESNVLESDLAKPSVAAEGKVQLFKRPNISVAEEQIRDITGYRLRKYACYDYSQSLSDDLLGTNACAVFRAAEAYLNYIEACYEKNGNIDGKADQYWRALRTRAGVDDNWSKTVNATDMAKEDELNDLAVWSGDKMIDATLYNIRRERRSELIGEGARWNDLLRWRSWDRLYTRPYVMEGINIWEEAYKNYIPSPEDPDVDPIIADNSSSATVSPQSLGKYQLPFKRFETNNQLYNGYTWKKAFYLNPIGIDELTLAPVMYQNPFWPSETAGKALE